MQIIRHADHPALPLGRSVVTLGNFDGIHLGHQTLIHGAVADARRLQVPSVVLTFEPHPLKILAPERAPKMLLAHKDKMELLRALGVDVVVIQTFNREFARMEAESFVREILLGRIRAVKIWAGQDLRFGRGRKGSVGDLMRWGGDLGFDVSVVEPILVEGVRVSSSLIRELVTAGRMAEVRPLLGRYYFISGRVGRGHRRGREIGFPTANISSRAEVLPADGIYATIFSVGGTQRLSVSSIGRNPTFGAGPRTVESFIFDFHDEIYGAAMKLAFVKRLREERKFDSVGALTAQIRQDVADARRVFDTLQVINPASPGYPTE
jgi:riboflavin kinase / FMN adenylyltransferase